MRIALFHDGDPRVPRLRRELEELDHEVLVVGPGVSLSQLTVLFAERRPDVIHSLGRGPMALLLAARWRSQLGKKGTRRAHDTSGALFAFTVDAVVDGSLPGRQLSERYADLLGLRG